MIGKNLRIAVEEPRFQRRAHRHVLWWSDGRPRLLTKDAGMEELRLPRRVQVTRAGIASHLRSDALYFCLREAGHPPLLCSKCGTNLPDGSQFCLKCGQAVTAMAGTTTPIPLLCSKCGTKLPDGSQFCLKCGQAVIAGSSSATAATTTGARRRRKRPRIAIWFLAPALVVAIWWAATSDHPIALELQRLINRSRSESITPETFSVKARGFSYYKFTVPPSATHVVVSGQFSASGGTDNDIEVSLFGDAGFVDWQSGYSPSAYYSSSRVTQGNINVTLPAGAGTYCVVFNNNFSPRTPKTVQADVLVSYKQWWPIL